MYALIQNETVFKYPYTVTDARRDNPDVSFPTNPDDAAMAALGVMRVFFTNPPTVDPATHKVVEDTPVFNVDRWEQVWQSVPFTPEELQAQKQAKLEQARISRQAAYTTEADPIFFMSQRGETTQADWLAKIEEIRQRYPYPV